MGTDSAGASLVVKDHGKWNHNAVLAACEDDLFVVISALYSFALTPLFLVLATLGFKRCHSQDLYSLIQRLDGKGQFKAKKHTPKSRVVLRWIRLS
jgi:hypothetical protein